MRSTKIAFLQRRGPVGKMSSEEEISSLYHSYVGRWKWRIVKLWLFLSFAYIHYAFTSNIAYLVQTRRKGAFYILAGYFLSQTGQGIALYILLFRRKQVATLLVTLFVSLESRDPKDLGDLFRKFKIFVALILTICTTLASLGVLDIMDTSTDNQYIFTADYYCFSCDPDDLTKLWSRVITVVDFTFYAYCVIGCGMLIGTGISL